MNKQVSDIWDDLHHELRKFIQGKVRDVNTTNDILQDVFLKIQLNKHSLKDCTKLTSWVYQITRNTVADHFRKKEAISSIEHFDLAEDEAEEPLYASLSNCLNNKINALPLKYKQAILLTSFRNYSQLALAQELNISYSGAKTRVQRGREKLKASINKCPNVQKDKGQNIIGYKPSTKGK